MNRAMLYLHGKGGSGAEAEALCAGIRDVEVIGLDYRGTTPWETREEILAEYCRLRARYPSVLLLANSIGAYFAMHALGKCGVERAFFISPILDMERLILDMMQWAQVTESMLRARGKITTDFGETLSLDYLNYVRAHPISWPVPTELLYGAGDHLTARETVDAFVRTHNARLTVMEGGEHWFHTPEQLSFLRRWLLRCLEQEVR